MLLLEEEISIVKTRSVFSTSAACCQESAAEDVAVLECSCIEIQDRANERGLWALHRCSQALRRMSFSTDYVQASGHPAFDAAAFGEVADAAALDTIWLPGSGKYGCAAGATNSERLASVQGEFDVALAEMTKEAQRAHKLDQKVRVISGVFELAAVQRQQDGAMSYCLLSPCNNLQCRAATLIQCARAGFDVRHAAAAQVTLVTKGLTEREAKLRKTTEDLWQQAAASRQELACFRALAANEVHIKHLSLSIFPHLY